MGCDTVLLAEWFVMFQGSVLRCLQSVVYHLTSDTGTSEKTSNLKEIDVHGVHIMLHVSVQCVELLY